MDSATARRICVTGAGGKAGRAVVQELVEHGYEISATDMVTTRDDLEAGVVRADLTDYGQALETLKGAVQRCAWPTSRRQVLEHQRSRSTPT